MRSAGVYGSFEETSHVLRPLRLSVDKKPDIGLRRMFSAPFFFLGYSLQIYIGSTYSSPR